LNDLQRDYTEEEQIDILSKIFEICQFTEETQKDKIYKSIVNCYDNNKTILGNFNDLPWLLNGYYIAELIKLKKIKGVFA